MIDTIDLFANEIGEEDNVKKLKAETINDNNEDESKLRCEQCEPLATDMTEEGRTLHSQRGQSSVNEQQTKEHLNKLQDMPIT